MGHFTDIYMGEKEILKIRLPFSNPITKLQCDSKESQDVKYYMIIFFFIKCYFNCR